MRGSWILALFLIAGKFGESQVDGFSILAISSNRPFAKRFEPKKKPDAFELKAALNQPYTYFGCGGQAHAFFSEDGQYVVKFFKQRLFRRSKLLNALPLPKFLHRYREKRNWKRDDKLERDFFSYKTAFDELQEETGVIYSHLNPTDHLPREFVIRDPLNICHAIDLNRFDFVVQRRCVPTYEQIDRLMEGGKVDAASRAIRAVMDLIATRAKKGFRDRDPNIRTNCGFLGEKAIKIDVGRFVAMEGLDHNAELERITAPFREWIEETHPELVDSFDRHLAEVLK